MDKRTWPVVERGEARAFVERCFGSFGVPADQAADMAELLLSADYRGHYSHGLNRIEMYVNEIEKACIDVNSTPVLLKETAATAFVDGRNCVGATVGKFCMNIAIKKAKETGLGWVVAKGSTHFGIAGWYSMEACKHGLLGMTFSSTPPVVFATRSKEQTLGTNPISLAAPVNNKPEFVLDMATSTVAYGKVRVAHRKQESIPHGWGSDSTGNETTNPTEVLNGGSLLPLGGTEISGGYKGYGLGLLVEILCSVLAGSRMTTDFKNWSANSPPEVRNVGQCFVAIDPSGFAEGFDGRLDRLLNTCRSKEPIDPTRPVLVPGDPEAIHMKMCDDLGGIPYHPNQIEHWRDLAKRFDVAEMKILEN